MKSKTSLLDRAILLNDFKSFAWIGVVYLLGLLLTVPCYLYLAYNSWLNNNYASANFVNVLAFNGDSSPFALFLIIIIPVLTGLLLFRYLQTNKSADMVHALPIQRTTLYNTHVLAGLILLFVPLLITALVSWAIVAGLQIELLSGQDVLIWLAISLLINLLFFMTSVATGMITGMSSVQGVLSYILLFLPTGLSVLLLHNISIYTYGFAYDYYAANISVSPLLRITDFSIYPIQTSEIITYILISILLYGLGRYLYQRRALERAGNALTFDLLYPLFKYGATFCFMLLLGSYFLSEANSLAWLYFAYFLGSFLAYFLMEILFKKSLAVFNLQTFKGYGIFALTMIILIAGLQFDGTGFEKKIPALADIESVYLDTSFHPLTYRDQGVVYASQYDNYEAPSPPTKSIYKDQANIGNIYALHQQIIANRAQERKALFSYDRNIRYERICMVYTLKNGQHIYRQYSIVSPNYAEQLKPIYESREFKKLHYDIFKLKPNMIDRIDINASEVNKSVCIMQPQLIEDAIAVLQRDILNETYEEMTSRRPAWGQIDIAYKNQNDACRSRCDISLSWRKSYVNFDQWLKNSMGNQARIIPSEDIAYAIVEKGNASGNETRGKYRTMPSHQYILELKLTPGNLVIKDSEKLETCLLNYTDVESGAYHIYFVLKNNNNFSGFFSESNVPAFVKEHFSG